MPGVGVSAGFVVMAAGSLGLLAFLCWATYRSGLLLRTVDIPFNILVAPAEVLVRLLLVAFCVGLALGVLIQVPLYLGANWAMRVKALARWRSRLYDPTVILNILPRDRRQWITVPLAFVPAVLLEELLFRSLLVGGLSAVAPAPPGQASAWLLAAGFALVFGAVHWPQGVLGVVATAAAGLVLAGLFLARDSLLPALVAHYVVNILQIVLAARQRATLEDLGMPGMEQTT